MTTLVHFFLGIIIYNQAPKCYTKSTNKKGGYKVQYTLHHPLDKNYLAIEVPKILENTSKPFKSLNNNALVLYGKHL